MNEYINGEELSILKNVQQEMVVENILPIGVVLFGAPEKTGKPFFALQMSKAVVQDEKLLGYTVNKGEVLYIALEDLKVSFQDRIKMINFEPSKHITFCAKTMLVI